MEQPKQTTSLKKAPPELKAELKQLLSNVKRAKVRRDIERIQRLMLDKDAMLEHLSPLETAITSKGGTSKHAAHKALTSSLAETERDAGFKLGMMPVDVLPGRVFGALPRLGFAPPKDPGAGVEHGESTHRLQWNAIINYHKQRPFSIPPNELLRRISSTKGLFGHLFDTASVSERRTDFFRRPDEATDLFLHDEQTRGALPALSKAVEQRHGKRAKEREAALETLAKRGGAVSLASAAKEAGRIYADKKTRQPEWFHDAKYEQVGHPNLLRRLDIPVAEKDIESIQRAAATQ